MMLLNQEINGQERMSSRVFTLCDYSIESLVYYLSIKDSLFGLLLKVGLRSLEGEVLLLLFLR